MIKVRLFGYLREKHGRPACRACGSGAGMGSINLKEGPATIKELASLLRKEHDVDVDLARFAVDNEFVNGSYKVRDGSTVDVIPPVAGG